MPSPSPRIFVHTSLNVDQIITLELPASWHLLKVLRLKIGDPLVLFNNSGGEYQTRLIDQQKNLAVVKVEEFINRNTESPLYIHLAQGISRGEKMDFTIQKAVELGVMSITPLFTAYCNVKLDDKRLEKKLQHWQGIATSAAEQSGRCYVPKVYPATELARWSDTRGADLNLVLDPHASNHLDIIKTKPQCISLLVGPEGGLSDQELAFTKQLGFLPISLGPRILRTETTALTAISILQARWGDLG